jgi:hypothetical protein
MIRLQAWQPMPTTGWHTSACWRKLLLLQQLILHRAARTVAVVSVAVRCYVDVQVSVSAYHQHHNHDHHNNHNHNNNHGHNNGRQQRLKDSKGLRELKVKQNKHILSTYNKAYDVFPKVGVAVAPAAACLDTSNCDGYGRCSRFKTLTLACNCTLTAGWHVHDCLKTVESTVQR